MKNEEMIIADINSLAAIQAQIDVLKKQAEVLEKGIKEFMKDQSLKKLETLAGHKALFTPYTSNRFDNKAMIAKYGKDEYDSLCKTTYAERFSVA